MSRATVENRKQLCRSGFARAILVNIDMSQFQPVCTINDLPVGQSKTVSIGGKLIAVFHDESGYHAIDDTCPHMGASLADGHVENGIVTCSWHAWRFRLADGAWADNPRIKIGCYPVRVSGDQLEIELPNS